jgi:nicotinamidase-related amidase
MTNGTKAAVQQKCDVENSLLLIIDIQTKLGQAMPTKVLNRVISNTSLLSRAAGLLDVPVVVTEQYPQGLGPTITDISDALPATAVTLDKTAFSSAAAQGFDDVLESANRKQIIIVGMESHICVLQSALDLLGTGYDVYVVEDAVCSRRLENYQNALDRLRQAGVGIISAESAIFEWLVHSRHEHFKAISAMLR